MTTVPAAAGDPARRTATRGAQAVPTLAFAAGVVVTSEFIVIGQLPALAADLRVSLEASGWLVSAFALSAALIGPLVTLAAPGRQPRRVLWLSLLVFGAAGLVPAIFPTYELMLIARVVQGALLTLFISTASAAVAGWASEGRAGRAVGHVNIGTVIGAAAAAPAGITLTGLIGWPATFMGLSVLAALAAGAVLRLAPATTPGPPPPPQRQAELLRQPRFLGHLLLSGLLFTAMFAAYSYITAFLESVWGLSANNVALALLGFGLAGVAGNWAASAVVDRNPTQLTAVVTAALVAATSALAWTQAGSAAGLLVLAAWGAAHTAAFVACQVRVMLAAPTARAFAAALNIAVCNAGIAAGATLGGWIISRAGITSIALGTAGAGLLALALCRLLPVRTDR